MKKLIPLLILSMLLTGCYKIYTPEQLLKTTKYFKEIENTKKMIENFLPYRAKLTIPKKSIDAGAINKIDIDGDKNEEIIAFYKKENELLQMEIGFIILKNINGSYKVINDISNIGYEIEYAGFFDLNNDKKQEIIISWSNSEENNKTKSIYEFKDNNIKSIFSDKCLNLEIVKINKEYKIISFNYDEQNKDLIISLKQMKADIKSLDTIKLKSTNANGFLDYKIGNIHKNKKGLIISTYKDENYNYIYSSVLEIEQDKLKLIFTDINKEIQRNLFILPEDIDNDGIIEIGYNNISLEYKNVDINQNIPYTTNWYKLNDKNKLIITACTYSDYVDGYILNIDSKIKNDLLIRQYNKYSSRDVIFYNYKSELDKKIEIFRISSINKKDFEEFSKQNPNILKLGENENKIIIGKLNEDELNKTKFSFIDKEYLINNFRLIY